VISISGVRHYFSKFFLPEFFLIIASVHDLPDAVTELSWGGSN
jgi:hypothetical protein